MLKRIWRAVEKLGKRIWVSEAGYFVRQHLAFMLYGGAEIIDGVLQFLTLGSVRSDFVRIAAADALSEWNLDGGFDDIGPLAD